MDNDTTGKHRTEFNIDGVELRDKPDPLANHCFKPISEMTQEELAEEYLMAGQIQQQVQERVQAVAKIVESGVDNGEFQGMVERVEEQFITVKSTRRRWRSPEETNDYAALQNVLGDWIWRPKDIKTITVMEKHCKSLPTTNMKFEARRAIESCIVPATRKEVTEVVHAYVKAADCEVQQP